MYNIDFTNNFQKIPPPRLRNDITTFFPLFFSFLDKMTHSLKYVQHWSPKKKFNGFTKFANIYFKVVSGK